MTRHDPEVLDQAVTGHSVAVSNVKFFSGPDVIEEVVHVCVIIQVNRESRIRDPLAIEVEARAPTATERRNEGDHDDKNSHKSPLVAIYKLRGRHTLFNSESGHRVDPRRLAGG